VVKGYEVSDAQATGPTVRRATPADAAIVVEFNRLLALESEGKALDAALLRPGVDAALADQKKALYFVAEDGGPIVGQTMVTYEWSDWRNGWFWWIQSVYVVAEARRRGVFKALYAHIARAARQDPTVIGIRLYVERENTRAQQTYRDLGMEETGYLVFERYPL
jgi:ribosomal protein S18 acetylase RimI-like enzyme